MNTEHYIVLAVFLSFFLWRQLRNQRIKRKLPELMRQGAMIIDVRTRQEYLGGSNPKAINIPLDSIAQEASSLNPHQVVIVCCASGVRSAMAEKILKDKGFKSVFNAGPWRNTLQ